jgi:hypothetical protein
MTWKFWRWRKEREARQIREVAVSLKPLFNWEDAILARGFHHWIHIQPPYGVTLELMRREWATIAVVDRDQVGPAMNCYGLWWRLADGPLIHGTKILDLSLMAPRGSA